MAGPRRTEAGIKLGGRGHPGSQCSLQDIRSELSEQALQKSQSSPPPPQVSPPRLPPTPRPPGSPSLGPGRTPSHRKHCYSCWSWRRPEWRMDPRGDGLGLRKGDLSVHRGKWPFSALGVTDPFKNLVEGWDTRHRKLSPNFQGVAGRAWGGSPGQVCAGSPALRLQGEGPAPGLARGGPAGAGLYSPLRVLPAGCSQEAAGLRSGVPGLPALCSSAGLAARALIAAHSWPWDSIGDAGVGGQCPLH